MRATAYHEAGHALAAVVLGRSVTYVTVVADDDSLGLIAHGSALESPDEQDHDEYGLPPWVDPSVPFDDKRYSEWMEHCDRVDRVLPARLARRAKLARNDVAICLAGPVAERRFAGRWNHVGASRDRDWALRLADGLSTRTLSAEKVIADEWQRAEDLIASHWPTVKVLASELLKKKRISGKRVREIVSAETR